MEPTPPGHYASCEWIEGGLAFNRGSLHTCLIAHHDRGLPFIAPFRGGELPMEAVLRVREEIRAANRAGRHPACAGCAHLKTQAWPAASHPVRIVGIAHYAHCNIKCSYCFLQTQDPASYAEGLRPYALLPTMRELVASGALAPDAIIDWGGGEPTVHPEIDELLALLLAHGTTHYLHTNGTRIPQAIRDTPHAARIHVVCSLDAGLASTYFAIKKRNYFERVWANLADYLRLGVVVTAKYIVTDENCAGPELDAFVARAADTGIRDLVVDIDYRFPQPSDAVVTGLGHLLHRARNVGIHARFGFTGDNFAVENGVAARAAAAVRREEHAAADRILRAFGYPHGHTLDARVEMMATQMQAHAGRLEDEVRMREDRIAALAAQVQAQQAEIARLRSPRQLLRTVAGAAVARAGLLLARRA